jgi:hypothetical protein
MRHQFTAAIAAILCFATTTLQAQASVIDGSDETLPDGIVTEVIVGLAETFADPSSAQFHSLQMNGQPKSIQSLCGFVNLKNQMGGYVGFQPFVYTSFTKELRVVRDAPGSVGYDFQMLALEAKLCDSVLGL